MIGAAGLLLLTSLTSSAAQAGGLAGVDWQPFSRGDAEWVLSGAGSGTRAAEDDGFLQPSLTAWAGPTTGNHAFLFHFAMVFDRAVSWTGTGEERETNLRSQMVGSLRPGFDWRFHLKEVDAGGVLPWVSVGGYGVVPLARYRDEAFTEAEQAAWNEVAREDRARIAAFGARAGAGVEHRWDSGVAVGARHLLDLHRAQQVDEDTYTGVVSLRTDTALYVGFAF